MFEKQCMYSDKKDCVYKDEVKRINLIDYKRLQHSGFYIDYCSFCRYKEYGMSRTLEEKMKKNLPNDEEKLKSLERNIKILKERNDKNYKIAVDAALVCMLGVFIIQALPVIFNSIGCNPTITNFMSALIFSLLCIFIYVGFIMDRDNRFIINEYLEYYLSLISERLTNFKTP